MGPMTGRATGYCVGYPVFGYMNPIPARGYGFGFGRGGWGRRYWFYATGLTGWQRAAYGYPAWGDTGCYMPYTRTPVSYKTNNEPIKERELNDVLKYEAKYMEHVLSEINKRIRESED